MCFIAKSIVLKKDSIELVGVDKWAVGNRKTRKISMPRTVENERKFARCLIVNDLQPIPSCGNYFWWWMTMELRKKYNRESTDTELGEAFHELWNEYAIRTHEPENLLVKILFYGSPCYIKTYGRRVRCISNRGLATPFTKYRAAYLADKYVAGKTELL